MRIKLSGRQPALRPGEHIRVMAILSPPPAPAAPGAFDFQRKSYFRRLGAVGFSVGRAQVVEGSADSASLLLRVERLRQVVAELVTAAVDGPAAAIAVALMTGQRRAIPKPLMNAIRDSGLAHLLAISGLHIGLVAAILFAGLRGIMALVPPLALRYPIKKWAALAAILGALAYALMAGATVPSQRAFLMVGLVLLAVVLDRRGLSMRLVAWAAVVILLLQPESLLGPSFQMSFAAVTALIAAYETARARRLFAGGGARYRRVWLRYGVARTNPRVFRHYRTLSSYPLAHFCLTPSHCVLTGFRIWPISHTLMYEKKSEKSWNA